MMTIKLLCACGQKYAFDVEPLNGRMGTTVACPACGADGTAHANQIIAQSLAAQAPQPPPAVPVPRATAVAPAVAANPAASSPRAPVAVPRAAAPTAAVPVAGASRAAGVPVRATVPSSSQPVAVPGNRPVAGAPVPAAAAPKNKLTKKQLMLIVVVTASGIIGSAVGRVLYKKGYFGMSEELKKSLTIMQAEVNSMAPKLSTPFLRMEAATVGPGKKFTYNYKLLTQKKSEMDVGKWRKTTTAELLRGVRSARQMRPIFDAGVTVCYRYKGKDDELIGEIEIEPSDVLGK